MDGILGTVHFLHCFREANMVAHTIAIFSYDNKISCNGVNEPSDFLVDAIVNHVTILPNQ